MYFGLAITPPMWVDDETEIFDVSIAASSDDPMKAYKMAREIHPRLDIAIVSPEYSEKQNEENLIQAGVPRDRIKDVLPMLKHMCGNVIRDIVVEELLSAISKRLGGGACGS